MSRYYRPSHRLPVFAKVRKRSKPNMKTVTTLLLLVFSYLSFAQTVTGMKFLKLVPDQTNGHVQDVYLSVDLQNDQHVPITASKEQFVLVDTQGNVYETSDSPFSGSAMTLA